MHLGLKIKDDLGNPNSVINWTLVIKNKPLNVGFPHYINQFMSKVY